MRSFLLAFSFFLDLFFVWQTANHKVWKVLDANMDAEHLHMAWRGKI